VTNYNNTDSNKQTERVSFKLLKLYLLFEVKFINFRDPKTKSIDFLLHTVYIITYISIKLVHY